MKSRKHSDQTNTEFAKTNQLFIKACELAKTPPSRRQASKFRGDKGKASRFFNEALEAMNGGGGQDNA